MPHAVVRTVLATPDPPPVGVPNPVHGDEGAASAGYRAALVAGVRIYGWVAENLLEALGPRWLDDGWADVTLRRPLFAGETVVVTAAPTADDGTWSVEVRVRDDGEGDGDRGRAAGGDGRVILDGTAGAGLAPWYDDVRPPPPAPALDPPPVRPVHTLDDIPLGVPFRPLGAFVSAAAAQRLATTDLGLERSAVPAGRLHPWFLAGRMAPLTRHNVTYGPTIHVRTQIQHRAPALAEREIVVGAVIVDAYDRNGHWYQVLDGVVHHPAEGEVARIRHTTIFRPRGTEPPPPLTA